MSDAGPANLGPRVSPFHCPYCAEEDFVPVGSLEEPDGQFHCRSCDRRYRLSFLGLGPGPAPGRGPGREAGDPWDSATP